MSDKRQNNKTDVLLISPPWYRFFGQQFSAKPLGLCSLAALLEKEGFNVGVYNADLEPGAHFTQALSTIANFKTYLSRVSDLGDSVWRDIKNTITTLNPSLVGISVVTAKYKSALTLAELIKQINPRIKIIAGGIHPTLCPEEMLKTGVFDYVVRGEGEYTILDLLNALKNGNPVRQIKGLSFTENGNIIHNPDRELIENLDTLPWSANRLILNKKDMVPDDFAHLIASRGCPYNCIFCASYKLWTHRVRCRSPKNIVDEIKMIKEQYSPIYFYFQDDSFTINKDFVHRLCEQMINEQLKVRWVCETRADLVTDELIKMLHRAGCFKIVLGAESGNEATLSRINKQVTKGQIRDAVRICKKNGLETSLYFMIGFPWETEKEINDTVRMMEELDPQYAVFSVATPYPGTELYSICQNEKLLPDSLDWSTFFHQSPEMFLTNKLTREQTKKIIEEVAKKFVAHNKKKHRLELLNPYRLCREIKRFYKQPKEILSKLKYIIR